MSLHLQSVHTLDFAMCGERVAEARCNLGRLAVGVLLTRPEEPAKTVLATARHDVHMKVGDTLTDDVVVGDERAMRVERGRHHGGDRSHAFEERADVVGREVGQGHDVTSRYYQRVTGEHRRSIEEGDDDIVTPHLVRLGPALDHVTEHT
jgi:hypothetical protein